MQLTFDIFARVWYVVHLQRQNDRDEYQVADGKVRQKQIRHRSQRLDLHNDDQNAYVAEEAKDDERRDEGYERCLAVWQTHCVIRVCSSQMCPSALIQ